MRSALASRTAAKRASRGWIRAPTLETSPPGSLPWDPHAAKKSGVKMIKQRPRGSAQSAAKGSPDSSQLASWASLYKWAYVRVAELLEQTQNCDIQWIVISGFQVTWFGGCVLHSNMQLIQTVTCQSKKQLARIRPRIGRTKEPLDECERGDWKNLAWKSTFKKLRSWHLIPPLHGK